MNAAPKSESPGGAGPCATNEKQPADSTADAANLIALDSARREKEVASLIALFALAGHAVHRGRNQDYLVSRWGMSRYIQDFAALQDFARRVGAAP